MDVGFLLSFASTASIILLFPVLKNVKLPLRGRIMEMALLSLSVQIGMLPIILYYFNSFPVFAIAANLIILPIISAVTVIGIVILILHFLIPITAFFAGFIIDQAIDAVFYMTGVISSLSYGNLNIISPGIYEIVLYYLAVGVGFKLIKLKGYRRRAANFFIITLLFVSLVTELFPSELKICFIDVGQGDCILITTPDRKNILIDGGGKPETPYSTIDIGEDVLLPYLYRNRVNKIHMVISTHSHEDHLKGLIPVMSSFDVGVFALNNFSELYKKAFEISGFGEHKVIDVDAGNIIKIGKDVDLYVLSPKEEEYDENDSSIVMKLVYKDFKALFTGDISSKAENKLLKYDIKSDVLKVPHHGSSTSLDENFLDRVDPEIAVICVGRNNFGHPAETTLEKINMRGISLYRTDKHGEIRIITRGKGFRVETAIKGRCSNISSCCALCYNDIFILKLVNGGSGILCFFNNFVEYCRS